MKNESGIKKSKKMTMWKVKMIREKKKKGELSKTSQMMEHSLKLDIKC
jgi:hypothetical protein